MKKNKKLLKTFSFPLVIAGILCSGGLLVGNNVEKEAKISSADFSAVENVENQYPDYFKIQPQEDLSYANDSIFLFQAGQAFDIKIATDEVSDLILNTSTQKEETKTNYAYIPDKTNSDNFYYFDFQTSLSLYYNITSEDIASGLTNENLIKNQNISNYTKQYYYKFTENEEEKEITSFIPNDCSFTPQQLDIQFQLDLLKTDIGFEDKTVVLNQEGCYTLAIPVVEYYTNNDGISFTAKEQTIYYTFMAFNANTYFDSTTGKPKLSTSDNLHQSLLGSSSSEFSTYYYYNFANNSLPEITYKPNLYQIQINYTDIDAQTHTTFIQYQDEKIVQLDLNGKEISKEEEFIKVRKNSDNTASIMFYDIGSYDINITYLYTLTNENGSTTFYLPFENLNNKNNDTVFQNKAQRLYIYGYQAVYSDYANKNPETNQPESVDLKTYNFDNGEFDNSADITSQINKLAGLNTRSQSSKFEIAEKVKETIDNYKIQPISTNQTPIKFLTNAKNANSSEDSLISRIYTKTNDGWSEPTAFQGFNENNAGTYLYIIQYNFDSYMSTNGTLQSAYFHYQIFYFTITNSAPTVDVFEKCEETNENGETINFYKEVYTNGYTNKSVYILNNAENNNYDASVTITLSARNYNTNSYYFKDVNIKNLSSYGFNYQKFEKDTNNENSDYNNKIAEKYGLLIENTNRYANAEFAIQIISPMSSKPSTSKFTIDTSAIQNIQTRNVAVQTSTNYKVINGFSGFSTNTPFIFSWDEKASGAQTYGYVKYIPTRAINYYSSLDNNNLAELLARLVDSHDTLPVSYKIDLSAIASSTWSEYKNSLGYTTSVPSTYVKSNDGFYILEVYDQAGNASFEIFLLDSSSPIFIEEISGDTTTQKILSNSESITVPENGVNITIKWTKNKAIYLENMTSETLQNISAYQYGIDVENANTILEDKLQNFFTTNNSNIAYFNDITAQTTNPDDDNTLVPTGIASFNGNYLIIPIDETVYIKEGSSSNFTPFNTSSYQIKFFDENDKLIADNTTYKILLRDQSNTYDVQNENINYKNYPSGYITFNVTSDASKLMLMANGESLGFSPYSLSGTLYSYLDKNGEIAYTHIADEEAENESGEKIYTQTDLGYKYSYYTPINGKKEIQLSYIPVADNGSKLQNVELKYYPYILNHTPYEDNQNTYFYYDIASEPTKTINIFTASDKTYDQGIAEIFEIALGTDSLPLAGKYVVERTYMAGNSTDKYDYFRRTLTFYVDNYNLITPLESVTNTQTGATSLESVVGGDIVLSMYSGENNSAFHVSFPTYKENGLNSGSFYTKGSFSDIDENITFSVEGNKLPMSIYIPQYKYTISNTEILTKENGIDYTVDKNNNLSYYGNAHYVYNSESQLYDVIVEGVVAQSYGTERQAINYINNLTAITEYQIYAEIKASVSENGKDVTKYYYTDGSENNGYLNFYLGDGKGNIIDKSQTIDYFYLKGDYVVTIYQANNQGGQDNFYTFYKFGFKINSQAPDFDIIGSNGYELNDTGTPNIYYSNSSELKIQWKVPTNEFEAEIDEKNIKIRSSNSPTYTYTGTIHDNTTTKYFTLNTSDLVKQNNSYLEITMQYEGHNALYYSTITKRIYFDRSAPTFNLSNLMTLTENATNRAFTANYQLMYMRKYANFDGNDMTLESINDISKVSYSYSIDTGYFKYYSYNVTTDFFNTTLLQTIQSASANPYDTQFVYYKLIENLDTYTQVDKSSFSAGNYYYITTENAPKVNCGYYEIVEMDYAGNMTVYLVYVTNSMNADDTNVRNDALTFSNSRTLEDIVYNNEIKTGYNIYSTSNFELKNVNYKSDPWSLMSVQIAGQSEQRFLKSPWLNDSQIYRITFSASGINFEQVSLKSIFENVESSAYKHKLTLTDRIAGLNQLIYLSIMDASLSPEKIEDPTKTSAILNIDVPTLAQVQSTTSTYIYPVNIKIAQYDPNMQSGENWVDIIEVNQEPYGIWTPTEKFAEALEYISFNTLAGGKTLQIVINLGANATQKVKYIITDNFGGTSTVIQLANEVGYKEISGSSIIYTDYESDGSITYLSDKGINYSYNVLLYSVEIFDKDALNITDSLLPPPNPTTNISVVNFTPSALNYYSDYYKILVWDIENESDKPLKTIHIRLYNKLPFRTTDPSAVELGGIIFNDKNQQPIDKSNISTIPSKTVNFNGKDYTSSADVITTFSQNVTLRFKDGQSLAFEGGFSYQNEYSYSVYLSRDNGLTWENINNATSDTSGYTISGVGEYIILIKYDSEEYFTNLCKIFTVSILDSSASYYYITVDGLNVEKSDIKYLSLDNREYDVNYIVSVDYADKDNRLNVIENEELGVNIECIGVDNTGSLVTVEIYHYECDESIGDFTIIYIAETNNIVNTLTYETASGSTTSIKDISSAIVVANNETEPNFNKLKINFSSFYGIESNKINVEILKLFNGSYTKIECEVYSSDEISYIYLERAGSYRIKFYDSCSPMNVQTFRNSQYFDMIFLSYVPFVVSQVDAEGNEIISEPVQRAVYNGTVMIKPTNLSSYYQTSGYPTISVKLNGHDYTGYQANNRVYTFTTPGYYSVKFTAKSTTGVQVREEEFNFTIINPNESREAYEFTQYEQYYIQQIIKDGVDITEDLISMTNLETININGKKYLAKLSISYLDEKTGEGRYKVIINHNKANLSSIIGENFAFEFWINHVSTLPISITTSDGTLKEGEKTTKDIVISFNVKNLYDAVGDCYIKVGDITKYYTAENIASYGQTDSLTILASGTYYVQVYTTGGRLLYSYKVIRTEPLNAFAILAIVLGVIAFIAVVTITIRLRKRQKVK